MSDRPTIEVRVGPALPRALPEGGLLVDAGGLAQAQARRGWLAVACARFVVLEVDAAAPDGEALQRLQRLASALEAQAVLRVAYPGTAGADALSALARAVADARLRLTRLVLVPVDRTDAADPAADYAAARAAFGDARIDTAAAAGAAFDAGVSVRPAAVRGRGADIDAAIALLGFYAAAARAGADGVAPCTPDDLLEQHGTALRATPAFHVFAGLARAAGATRIALAASDPAAVEMLAHRINGGLRLWLANPSIGSCSVRLAGLPPGRGVRRALAADGLDAAAANVRSYADAALPLDLASPVDLAPRSVSVVELEFPAGHPMYA